MQLLMFIFTQILLKIWFSALIWAITEI